MNLFKVVGSLMIIVSIQVALFGCGSGNGDGNGGPVTSRTRALQVGDSWTYDANGQTPTQNNQSYQYSGTIIISVTLETINGESVLAKTSNYTYNVSGPASSGTSVEYFQQDSGTGDIMLYGNKNGNNPIITVTDRPLPVIRPGSWEAGKTITANIHYSDGSTAPGSYTIIEQETVMTPAGAFATWKCVANSGSDSSAIWFAPQLGNYVKLTTNEVTFILRSTNVTGS